MSLSCGETLSRAFSLSDTPQKLEKNGGVRVRVHHSRSDTDLGARTCPQLLPPCRQYVHLPNFDVASDAFVTLRDLLTRNKAVASEVCGGSFYGTWRGPRSGVRVLGNGVGMGLTCRIRKGFVGFTKVVRAVCVSRATVQSEAPSLHLCRPWEICIHLLVLWAFLIRR